MGRDANVGRWIDSLDEASRDRVIEHPDPTYNGKDWWSMDRDCGCLVGCAVGQSGAWRVSWQLGEGEVLIPFAAQPSPYTYTPVFDVGVRFYRLAKRFGAERMWRLVKARAAKANRVVIPAVAEEAALA